MQKLIFFGKKLAIYLMLKQCLLTSCQAFSWSECSLFQTMMPYMLWCMSSASPFHCASYLKLCSWDLQLFIWN